MKNFLPIGPDWRGLVWQAILDQLEPFRRNLPTVLAASGFAGLWGLFRAWKSYSRSARNYGCFARCCSLATSAIVASLGAAVCAGLTVEWLEQHPWFVVMASASAGIAVDVTTANGPRRLVEESLRLLARVQRILRDNPRGDQKQP